jgi:hypothetical protein
MPETPTELITKRLHISGLTPAISSHDLERRLGSFGTITTGFDGLGKFDALGQPRTFAHVTLETTKAQLSRCTPCHGQAGQLSHPLSFDLITLLLSSSGMNLLSGSTWKGAKLRIGEAKPDFRER